jgi:hypothetical protein
MTAFTRALPLFGLLLCFPACGEEANEPASAPSALAPADEPLLAASADADLELEPEPDAPMIYAGRSDLGTDSEAPAEPRATVGPEAAVSQDGIYLDSMVIGRGFSNHRCETETGEFTVGEDDRVNVCMRVMHFGHTEEPLTVKWTRNGHGPKATRVSLHNGRSWRTRAYLPIRHYSKGDWHVEVTASDGSVLGEGDFVVR